MAEGVCEELISERPWKKYTDTKNIPHTKGIYVIGVKIKGKRDIKCLYLGRSKDVHKRLANHKHGCHEIDEYVRRNFKNHHEKDLRVKWIEEPKPKEKETAYINCLEQKLDYKLEYNKIGRGKKYGKQ